MSLRHWEKSQRHRRDINATLIVAHCYVAATSQCNIAIRPSWRHRRDVAMAIKNFVKISKVAVAASPGHRRNIAYATLNFRKIPKVARARSPRRCLGDLFFQKISKVATATSLWRHRGNVARAISRQHRKCNLKFWNKKIDKMSKVARATSLKQFSVTQIAVLCKVMAISQEYRHGDIAATL